MEISQNTNNRTTIWSSYPISGSSSKEYKNTNWKRNTHPYVHCSIIYNSLCIDKEDVCVSVHLVVSSSLRPHGLQPAMLLCLWDYPSKNTGMGCHALLQVSWPSDLTRVSCIGRQILSHWAMWEVSKHTHTHTQWNITQP